MDSFCNDIWCFIGISFGVFSVGNPPIGREVDEDKIDASFKEGILTITLPKTEQGQHTKRISVKRAA